MARSGVQYQGDGYTDCKPVGPGRCAMNNGGCWKDTRHGKTFSACSDSDLSGCKCPPGFKGDGFHCHSVKMLTSAARNLRARALTAPGRTHGVDSTASARVTSCT